MSDAPRLTALDSSILVAALLPWHEHHAVAQRAIRQARQEGALLVASRTLVETYSVLTRLPAPHRQAPDDAMNLLELNFRSVRVESLEADSTWSFLSSLPSNGVAGGAVFDAEIATVAARAGAEAVVTLDRKGFGRGAPPDLEIVVPTG